MIFIEPDTWDCPDFGNGIIDLGAYHIIGGILRFELIKLPRQPKINPNWTITTCVIPSKLNLFNYQIDVETPSNGKFLKMLFKKLFYTYLFLEQKY